MNPSDSPIERDALRLLRDVLDAAPAERDALLAGTDAATAERVRTLLACVDERETKPDFAPDAADSVDGVEIGPYRLVELIGRGGMGEVFRAARADGTFEREVALKRIWGGFTPLTGRFLRERQMLARLQHPGIAQLFDGGVTAQGQPWFAMELVRGEPITRWCDARNVTLEQRVDLMRQVCAAVDFAHRALIVHRDLKPANVLVDAAGTVKLLDFGIAKLLDETDAQQTQTLAMTPAWAAPEQRDGRPVTTAADVWQLGMLLRVLLADDLPAQGREPARVGAAFDARRRSEPTRAAEIAAHRGLTSERLRARLRGDLDSIVAQATARDPEERYRSASALADDLARWRDGLPVLARHEERGYRMRRMLRRRWPAIAAVLAGVVFLGYHVASLDSALQRTQVERNRALVAERQAAAQRMQAERERDAAQAVSRHFVTMFRAASPAATRGGDISARQLLSAGEAKLEEAVANAQSPRAIGAIWQALAQVHTELGDYPRSLELAGRAVAQLRGEGDPLALAEALRTQAWAHYFQDHPREFRELVGQSHALLVRERLVDAPVFARVSSALGLAEFVNGAPEKNWRHFDASVALGRKLGVAHADDHVKNLLNASAAAVEAGDYVRARDWLSEAATTATRMRPRNVDSELMIGTNLGVVLRRVDRLDEAHRHYVPLIGRAREHYGPGHPRLAFAQLEMATIEIARGRPRDALALLDPLERTAGQSFAAGHSSIADITGLRGVALLLDGDENAARVALQRARDIRAGAYTPESRGALEQVARARVECAPDLAAKAEALRVAPGVEPWQQRLAQRWLEECAARRVARR